MSTYVSRGRKKSEKRDDLQNQRKGWDLKEPSTAKFRVQVWS